MKRWIPSAAIAIACAIGFRSATGQAVPAPPPADAFLKFIQTQAAQLHAHDQPPKSLEEWDRRRSALRDHLTKAWGGFPDAPCPLEPKHFGTIERDSYRIEKIAIQTRPGVWMTTNAYVPDRPGKRPAVLCVHGHWRGAKQDPVVQSRCIGLAKLGVFVLVVDAFGAGERGIGEALGEYHGEMTGAALLPIGLPLSGIQVYENMRAVDYLKSRSEVDGDRIGITGASGGGNQSMYAGAYDPRFAAVTPVCSVGTYQAYLGAACCMCEVVPGALRFAEESDVLGLVTPRALMIVNATQDAFQFSVGEAKKSFQGAQAIYSLYGEPDRARHTIFNWKHDYHQPIREAMYGWMAKHLQGTGDGSPIPEPAMKTEDPESLRCYPGDSRPDDFMTIPKFAAQEGRRLLSQTRWPKDAREWRDQAESARRSLRETVFGGDPAPSRLNARAESVPEGRSRTIAFEPEPGLSLVAKQDLVQDPKGLAIVLDLEGAAKANAHPIHAELQRGGWSVLTMDLRATGRLAHPRDQVGKAPDHNTAEWAMWIGRPLLGQWTVDVRRLVDAIAQIDGATPKKIAIVGIGPAGLAALSAAALDERIQSAAAIGSLASYVAEAPCQGQRLGIFAPGIVRDVGDVPRIASLIAPRRTVIAGGVRGDGQAVAPEELRRHYRDAASAWSSLGSPEHFLIVDPNDVKAIARGLN